mmetsp:Transcript_9288/g.21241  ORF Transcript_9288/g.21241 Transcript_9288/m.21241 type:complete len:404 (-) Transcript_9288:137-1348(-)
MQVRAASTTSWSAARRTMNNSAILRPSRTPPLWSVMPVIRRSAAVAASRVAIGKAVSDDSAIIRWRPVLCLQRPRHLAASSRTRGSRQRRLRRATACSATATLSPPIWNTRVSTSSGAADRTRTREGRAATTSASIRQQVACRVESDSVLGASALCELQPPASFPDSKRLASARTPVPCPDRSSRHSSTLFTHSSTALAAASNRVGLRVWARTERRLSRPSDVPNRTQAGDLLSSLLVPPSWATVGCTLNTSCSSSPSPSTSVATSASSALSISACMLSSSIVERRAQSLAREVKDEVDRAGRADGDFATPRNSLSARTKTSELNSAIVSTRRSDDKNPSPRPSTASRAATSPPCTRVPSSRSSHPSSVLLTSNIDSKTRKHSCTTSALTRTLAISTIRAGVR